LWIYPNPVTGSTVQILPPPYSGDSVVRVDGNPLSDGLYYVVVTVNGKRTIGKLLLLR
jgi:hypothetical protein